MEESDKKRDVSGQRICKAMKKSEDTDRQGRGSEKRPGVVKKVAWVPSSLSEPRTEADSTTQLGGHTNTQIVSTTSHATP